METKKEFIELGRINPIARNQFKYKLGLRGYVGFILVGFGLVTLPLPTGSPLFIGFGLMLISPINLKYQLRNKRDDLKYYVNKKMILWGLI